MGERDKIFAKKKQQVEPFLFNHEVASVFDDMVSRSVPFYNEVHKMILDVAGLDLPDRARIYDLGCSTGHTILSLHHQAQALHRHFSYFGVDSSAPMIAVCRKKLQANGVADFTLMQAKIEDVPIQNANMVILNYTMQFISPKDRPTLLKKIVRGLAPKGIVILSEKIKSNNSHIQELTTKLYYDFKKRNGYSELEIAQKREALENVLMPWTPEKNLLLLKNAGLKNISMLFKWYNFASFIGYK
ncbi:MAG: carboxy-S-adenosyl-L-methionine synthase CmoA [Bdellovibrionales bacterium GWA2_49_15]|nr:MAG: carboxy-S-adenosyl-L-methionine synthase CmoA [Bdellovibrionales bacterium GWA2_49_15]HAZ12327.1 carboxy-S-adenosyl-L-methionine synthase CmoA [Bdellovibrionales bacterium]